MPSWADYHFPDTGETWTTWVKRGVLNARRGASPGAQLTVSGVKPALVGVILDQADPAELADAGTITLHGDASVLNIYRSLIDKFDPNYHLVTP
jgi:alkyl sulfatase BDS1-like metallo-beta-lactamase superfamily hydrolase